MIQVHLQKTVNIMLLAFLKRKTLFIILFLVHINVFKHCTTDFSVGRLFLVTSDFTKKHLKQYGSFSDFIWSLLFMCKYWLTDFTFPINNVVCFAQRNFHTASFRTLFSYGINIILLGNRKHVSFHSQLVCMRQFERTTNLKLSDDNFNLK